ncbi:hypothetical protein CPB86DRAFT_798097 [Serendipita vermifera]|nr:hypothetical protein CPB86DRAFT_798097 [Serendipita vermifera]
MVMRERGSSSVVINGVNGPFFRQQFTHSNQGMIIGFLVAVHRVVDAIPGGIFQPTRTMESDTGITARAESNKMAIGVKVDGHHSGWGVELFSIRSGIHWDLFGFSRTLALNHLHMHTFSAETMRGVTLTCYFATKLVRDQTPIGCYCHQQEDRIGVPVETSDQIQESHQFSGGGVESW